MSSVEYTGDFYYQTGKKHTRVEYMERGLANGRRIVVCRDIDENEKMRYNYLRSIDQGKDEYTYPLTGQLDIPINGAARRL